MFQLIADQAAQRHTDSPRQSPSRREARIRLAAFNERHAVQRQPRGVSDLSLGHTGTQPGGTEVLAEYLGRSRLRLGGRFLPGSGRHNESVHNPLDVLRKMIRCRPSAYVASVRAYARLAARD